jgi:hypothetical protein
MPTDTMEKEKNTKKVQTANNIKYQFYYPMVVFYFGIHYIIFTFPKISD